MLTLQGQSVRLAPMELDHAEALLAAANEDRSTYTFTNIPHDLATMQQFIQLARADLERGAAVPFTTFDVKTGRAVGATRFMTLDRWAPPFEPALPKDANPDGAEIGSTWLSGSAQRTAINTEAKLLMLGHAFEVWKVQRVTLKTDARNQRSRDAIARLGARLDGVLRAWQRAAEGGPRDTAVFSIVAAQWPQVQERLQKKLRR